MTVSVTPTARADAAVQTATELLFQPVQVGASAGQPLVGVARAVDKGDPNGGHCGKSAAARILLGGLPARGVGGRSPGRTTKTEKGVSFGKSRQMWRSSVMSTT